MSAMYERVSVRSHGRERIHEFIVIFYLFLFQQSLHVVLPVLGNVVLESQSQIKYKMLDLTRRTLLIYRASFAYFCSSDFEI